MHTNKQEAKQKETQDLLNSATVKLNDCLEEKATADTKLKALEDQNAFLKANNQELINNMGNLTTLTTKGAENLEKSLESLQEKDLTIRKLQNAVTRRDSVNLALVQSLKGVLGNLDDEDIEKRWRSIAVMMIKLVREKKNSGENIETIFCYFFGLWLN